MQSSWESLFVHLVALMFTTRAQECIPPPQKKAKIWVRFHYLIKGLVNVSDVEITYECIYLHMKKDYYEIPTKEGIKKQLKVVPEG